MQRKEKRDSRFYVISVAVLIAVLVFSSLRALQIYLPQRREQNSFDRLRQEISSDDPQESASAFVNRYESLMAQNGDFACWLQIPDSVVDYPVMKSSEDDPEFYLRRGFDKKYASAGCLFIGGGCNSDSKSFVIYGHNMNNGSMFGALLCGIAYWRTKNIPLTCLAEVFGTAVLGGLCAYPIALLFMGKTAGEIAFYAYVVPFLISTAGGALISAALIYALKRPGVLHAMQEGISR